ncbi:unnamed protein product [Choristocarpus tenellus]
MLVAKHHGSTSISLEDVMKGKKGRRTDKVIAKAVGERLTSISAGNRGWVLTGFPTTAAQAKSLEEQGIKFDNLIVVHDEYPEIEIDGGMATEVTPEEEEAYYGGTGYLMEQYEDKVIEVMHVEKLEELCGTVTKMLDFTVDSSVLAQRAEEREDVPRTMIEVSDFIGDDTSLRDWVEEEEEFPDAMIQTSECTDDVTDFIERVGEGGNIEGKQPEQRDILEAKKLSEDTTRIDQEQHSPKHKPAPPRAEARISAEEGAMRKREAKNRIRAKKRASNEAQRLDTPFYMAVANNLPKARVKPPPKTVPSKINERLGSASRSIDDDDDVVLDFGPLVLRSPVSNCLLAAGITEPTGIQEAGMGPIRDGESVILHAMTGSGKTLAFLLPLMQRFSLARPWQIVLALPTRELAVQVARETALLLGGDTMDVELLVDQSMTPNLDQIKASIVVGSAKILERSIRKSRPRVREYVLNSVECLVVDEVDRLVDTLPKHAPPREVEKRKKHARPITALLLKIMDAKPSVQVVACSATIGRPLRRELAHILRRPNVEEGIRVVRDVSQTDNHNLAHSRAVAIPPTIKHYYVPLPNNDFFTKLQALTAAVVKLGPKRPLVFVPPEERVTAVVAHLRRSGTPGAVALHEAMGFASGESQHSAKALLEHDRLTGQFGGDGGEDGGDRVLQPSVLVTSEDSARGLHFDDVDYVFLMKRSKSIDEYVHLAGRTGRGGKEGNVVSLVSNDEVKKLQAWETSLDINIQEMTFASESRVN